MRRAPDIACSRMAGQNLAPMDFVFVDGYPFQAACPLRRTRTLRASMSTQEPVRQSNPMNWTVAVWLLYLGGYVTLITIIVGLIIAYIKRPEFVGTPYHSHMTSAIRTFWISLIVGVIGIVLSFVVVGFFVLIALAGWQIFRCVRGLIRAINGQPIEDPAGWL
jgi:uncharacterized membrane protein